MDGSFDYGIRFLGIEDFYVQGCAIQVKYEVTPGVGEGKNDWIGLYPAGWTDIRSYYAFVGTGETSKRDTCRGYTKNLAFPTGDLGHGFDFGKRVNFVYVKKNRNVLGVSESFELLRAEEEDDSGPVDVSDYEMVSDDGLRLGLGNGGDLGSLGEELDQLFPENRNRSGKTAAEKEIIWNDPIVMNYHTNNNNSSSSSVSVMQLQIASRYLTELINSNSNLFIDRALFFGLQPPKKSTALALRPRFDVIPYGICKDLLWGPIMVRARENICTATQTVQAMIYDDDYQKSKSNLRKGFRKTSRKLRKQLAEQKEKCKAAKLSSNEIEKRLTAVRSDLWDQQDINSCLSEAVNILTNDKTDLQAELFENRSLVESAKRERMVSEGKHKELDRSLSDALCENAVLLSLLGKHGILRIIDTNDSVVNLTDADGRPLPGDLRTWSEREDGGKKSTTEADDDRETAVGKDAEMMLDKVISMLSDERDENRKLNEQVSGLNLKIEKITKQHDGSSHNLRTELRDRDDTVRRLQDHQWSLCSQLGALQEALQATQKKLQKTRRRLFVTKSAKPAYRDGNTATAKKNGDGEDEQVASFVIPPADNSIEHSAVTSQPRAFPAPLVGAVAAAGGALPKNTPPRIVDDYSTRELPSMLFCKRRN